MAPRTKVIEDEVLDEGVEIPNYYKDADGGHTTALEVIRMALGREGYIAYLRGEILARTFRLTRKEEDFARASALLAEYARLLREVLAEAS